MKMLRLAVLAACGFLLIFAGCSARIEEAADAFPEDAADWLSTDAGRDAGPALSALEPDSPSPALTLADIRMAYVSDLSNGDGCADYIRYVVYRDFMQTDGDGRFNPEGFVIRGELLNALWHMSGQEAPAYDGTFPDVTEDSPWINAVSWAVQADIAVPAADGTLSPQTAVTREQLALFLYRFAAEGPADRDTIDAYRDGGLVEEYARAPLA